MQENKPDTVYKWTIRAMYGIAMAVNLWYLLEISKDTPEGQNAIMVAKNAWGKIVMPWRNAKSFRRMADETLVEAWVIVDQADKEKND